ncbi:hypothetical protein [Streptomyces sp. NPDC020965]|uniref:hypothetical protein n=1 Tax=Streptomyces sp. NPDC020965 TaxID=3365105 RepID=UPI0037AC4A08
MLALLPAIGPKIAELPRRVVRPEVRGPPQRTTHTFGDGIHLLLGDELDRCHVVSEREDSDLPPAKGLDGLTPGPVV